MLKILLTPAGVAARRMVKRLPLFREPEMQRVLANVGLATRSCSRCEHFDLKAGQAALARNPAMLEATRYLSPAQMGRLAEADGQVAEEASLAQWSEFGACLRHQEVRHGGSTCDDWSY